MQIRPTSLAWIILTFSLCSFSAMADAIVTCTALGVTTTSGTSCFASNGTGGTTSAGISYSQLASTNGFFFTGSTSASSQTSVSLSSPVSSNAMVEFDYIFDTAGPVRPGRVLLTLSADSDASLPGFGGGEAVVGPYTALSSGPSICIGCISGTFEPITLGTPFEVIISSSANSGISVFGSSGGGSSSLSFSLFEETGLTSVQPILISPEPRLWGAIAAGLALLFLKSRPN
jgi:hypothetical protein